MEASYYIVLIDTNESFSCHASESILCAMERAHVKPFPSGCKVGGCGICKIRVTEGQVRMGAVSREPPSQTTGRRWTDPRLQSLSTE